MIEVIGGQRRSWRNNQPYSALGWWSDRHPAGNSPELCRRERRRGNGGTRTSGASRSQNDVTAGRDRQRIPNTTAVRVRVGDVTGTIHRERSVSHAAGPAVTAQGNYPQRLAAVSGHKLEHAMDETTFADLVGKTITMIDELEVGSERVTFKTSDGSRYVMQHVQDCCESVEVEDVNGDVAALIGSPVTLAEESTSEDNPEGVTPEFRDDSQTWTFYRIATAKGLVVIRWYGTSNGYYSESVDFTKESA